MKICNSKGGPKFGGLTTPVMVTTILSGKVAAMLLVIPVTAFLIRLATTYVTQPQTSVMVLNRKFRRAK